MKPVKRKELLEAPWREWGKDTGLYDSVYIVPSRKEHDSGYMLMALVGVRHPPKKGDEPEYELAAWCDDIGWIVPASTTVLLSNGESHAFADMRMDCGFPSGITRMWGRGKFKIGDSLSSTDVTFIKEGQEAYDERPGLGAGGGDDVSRDDLGG